MSFNRNTKNYNKQVMQTGKQANQYYRNALNLINKYTTDYSGRLDYWQSKLNDRQLNLLSDKYLQQNAAMLRGQGAFGSNSTLNQQINDNAYSQQTYLANVANDNVKVANQLQANELSALGNAASTYNAATAMGGQAAQNVDAANNSWLNVLGSTAGTAGTILSAIPTPWTQAAGTALKIGGDALSSAAGQVVDLGKTGSSTRDLVSNISENFGSGELASRLKIGNQGGSESTLSSQIGYNPNNYRTSSDWTQFKK